MKKIRFLVPFMALPLLAQLPAWQLSPGPPAPWLRWLGNGADGRYVANNGDVLYGDLQYTSFTVPAGTAITVSNATVRSLGPCVVDGNISASGVAANGAGGGTGGGGGAGSAMGHPGGDSATSLLPGAFVNGGVGGLPTSGVGAPGQLALLASAWAPSSDINAGASAAFRAFIADGWGLDGFGIGGATGGQGGNAGGFGGSGGGHVFLICASIGGGGSINASGAAGLNSAANNTGAGGGGGGGAVILSAQQSITFSGNLNVAGGAGGTCGSYSGCGPGGPGGNGWIYAVSGWQTN